MMDCQLCSAPRARYRGHILISEPPLPTDRGVPLPDGGYARWLCDDCDDAVALYWQAVEQGVL